MTDVTSDNCYPLILAIDDALYAIGGKWKIKIVTALMDGGKRFNQLRRVLKGISAKVLSHELKELEANGFIGRITEGSLPASTVYELKSYSHTLYDVVLSLGKWGKMHREHTRQQIKDLKS